MTDVVTILSAASANGTGPVIDAGDLKGNAALEVFTTGTVSAFSVQVQGSLDGANWFALGAPVTTTTTAALTGPLARWFKAVLSGYTGSGTVTATLAYAAGSAGSAAAVGTETTRAEAAEAAALQKASNLSDLGNFATARTNLGLGTAATSAASAFDASGAAATEASRAQAAELITANNTAQVFSPMNYGAAGNGTTDDTTPVLAAFSAAQSAGGIVELGSRTFLTSSPVPAYVGMHVRGSSLESGGIVNSTSSLFTLGNVYDVTFEDCVLNASGTGTGGGHVWDATSGTPDMSFIRILGVQAFQSGTGYSIWSQLGGQLINSLVSRECTFWMSASATVPGWNSLQVNNTSVTIEHTRTNAGNNTLVPFFCLDMQTRTGTGLDIVFRDLAIEQSCAGSIYVTAGFNVTLENVRAWDHTSVTGNLFSFTRSGGGYACSNISIRQIGNNGAATAFTDSSCSTTASSATVTDASAANAGRGLNDIGSFISSATGTIPPGTTITGLTGTGPSYTGYTLSANATVTASGQTFAVNKYWDLYADQFTAGLTVDTAGSFGSAAVMSYPAAQSSVLNCMDVNGIGGRFVHETGFSSPYLAASGKYLGSGGTLNASGCAALSRWVGATASGHPTSGLYQIADWVVDQSGAIWICTAAGSPGTWSQVGGAAADYAPTGLTGATSASRYVGATASGHPASGTFAIGDWVVDRTGYIWICTTAGTSGTWAQVGPASGYASLSDPLGLGVNATAPSFITGANSALAGANYIYYVQLAAAGGYPMSDVYSVIGTQSGNMAVGLYSNNGSGAPGTLVATSGSVTTPAAGLRGVSLGGTYTPAKGDFLAIAFDNTTAKVTGISGVAYLMNPKGCQYQNNGSLTFPSPATPISGASVWPILQGY